MRNSLKDAMQSALKKVGNIFSPSQSKPEPKAKESPKKNSVLTAPKTATQAQEVAAQGDAHFRIYMEKMGVKRTNVHDTTIHETPSVAEKRDIRHVDPVQATTKTKKWPLKETIRKSNPEPIKAKKETTLHKEEKGKTNPKQSQAVTPLVSPYMINVTGKVTPHSAFTSIVGIKNPLITGNDGINEQLCGKGHDDEREVVIGFDFGTSCAKIVIGDPALGKAFAVPFSKGSGLSSFLLPSRVWLSGRHYTLKEKGDPRRNLKLRLIENNCSPEYFMDAVAFIALVIRHSRGWLFTQHNDIYKRIRIQWKLSLGLPAATYNQKHLVERFNKIAAAAWLVAGHPEGDLSMEEVERICKEVDAKNLDTICEMTALKDVIFDVVPELSAQVYGFLTSNRFDAQARNIFMMVDVGAGTVDSSVFHVARKRGKYSFNFYANHVEFNGVVNLHSARMQWIKNAFSENSLISDWAPDFESIEMPTDMVNGIPEKIEDYFDGIDVSFHDQAANPDTDFFNKRLKHQVLADTLQGARECVENEAQFEGMPLFLCGGGSRMKYYKKLEETLRYHPNATWFNFNPQRLEVPSILSAPGVVQGDFDRLSVAFGLSFLNVGEFVRGIAIDNTPVLYENPNCCSGCGATGGNCYCD